MAKRQFTTYSAIVQSSGVPGAPISRIHKTGLTAPEMAVLFAIHGRECMPREHVKITGKALIDENRLRTDIADRYRTQNIQGAAVLAELFGAMGALPLVVEDAIPGYMDDEDADPGEDYEAVETEIDKLSVPAPTPSKFPTRAKPEDSALFPKSE